MPLIPWPRWMNPGEPSRPPLDLRALQREVERLAADSRVHRVFLWFREHEREIADFQIEITRIPAPPFGEKERASWLSERLSALGLGPVEMDEVGNVLAYRRGKGSDDSAVALSAHVDTVFPAHTDLDVHREHTRLLGPGVSDNGAGLAALWALASALQASDVVTEIPLLFIGNVGEEGEGDLRGMRHIFRAGGPKIATLIAVDGAGVENVIAEALGSRRFEIIIEGHGGHSWSDFGAANPIVAASVLIDTLSKITLPSVPKTTLNIGTIEGGTSVNTIPESVKLRIDIRSTEPKRIEELELAMRRAVTNAVATPQPNSRLGRSGLTFRIVELGDRPAAELRSDSPLLAAVRAVDRHLGIDSHVQRASTDANIPLSLGIDAVAIGGGGIGGGAHTVREWYDPAGRDLGLKRIALILLALAGLPADNARAE